MEKSRDIQMIKLTRRPLRWILALVMIPVGPGLVYLLANLGKEFGNSAAGASLPLLLENPWILVAVGAVFPALLFGLLVKALMGS